MCFSEFRCYPPVQFVAPSDLATRPAGQALQFSVSNKAAKNPLAHNVQLEAAAAALLPGEQEEQFTEKSADRRPDGQLSQLMDARGFLVK